ncbi:MAG TPA: NAD(P)/FAD-dependent oxidoreductase [Clostridia bacterium]|nr:NAD(P)/FAD-dependent oxidoreductase [Clostridia bacterium]
MKKNVIIVGAGIAGLSAGVYALQSGFNVTIYESHTIPGGASTSWRRKGYLFEGGLHWLTGSSPRVPLHKIWREVGALDDTVEIYNKDPFFTAEYQGKQAHLYQDTEKLRHHLRELSPEDGREIDRLIADVVRFESINSPVMDIPHVKVKKKSPGDAFFMLKMLPVLPRLSYYSKQSTQEYVRTFKSPLVRMLLENVAGGENNAAALVFTLATLAAGDGGYPKGGSLAMAARMAKKFLSLGGAIHYGKPVDRVWVQNGTARGVIVNGEHIAADAVIVTIDTLVAIESMFDAPIHEPWAEKMRRETLPMLDTFICAGVEADLSCEPERLVFAVDEPLICGGVPEYEVNVNHYAPYEGYAPAGCTALTSAIIRDSYDFWKACREDGTYEAEKQKLAESFIRKLNQRYPQTEGKVAVWDVATPLTYERYLHSYKGSWMTIMKKGAMPARYPCRPESIGNVYFAGQRLMSPGGTPVAVQTGRMAVQYLCRDTDAVFQGNL